MQLSIENSKLLFGHENDLLQASWMTWRSNREKDHAQTPDHRRNEDVHASYMLRERLLVVHNPETVRVCRPLRECSVYTHSAQDRKHFQRK